MQDAHCLNFLVSWHLGGSGMVTVIVCTESYHVVHHVVHCSLRGRSIVLSVVENKTNLGVWLIRCQSCVKGKHKS